jgi:hypothetical protein
MTKQDCRNEQGSAAKNSRAPYIKEIPEETPNLETTTTTYPYLDNEKSRGKKATEASSSRRSFVGEESSESLRDRIGDSEAEIASALVDQLVREYGLSGKQRQTVSEYCYSRGEEYVRSKATIVRAQPRRNAAGALLAALRDDWKPTVATKPQTNATHQGPVRPGNRNIGNSNEYCDFRQYKSRD